MDSKTILSLFDEITKIPRESGHEEKIVDFLVDFAQKHNLEYKTDKAMNVLIVKHAAKGYETVPTLVLQSHTDMVCEKNAGCTHDFAVDPIKYVIKDGWMVAEETTLGADCGIGVAAQLAVLTDTKPTGKIECLFTASEETGMDGAFGLEPGFISGDTLINLDSEDEGELFVGCAGGIDTTAVFDFHYDFVHPGAELFKLRVFNGVGGHSGDDINKGRANAVQTLARFLYGGTRKDSAYQAVLCHIDGGNKRNAIAREAEATVAVTGDIASFKAAWNQFACDVKAEYSSTEPDLSFSIENGPATDRCMEKEVSDKLIIALLAAPHGVLAMSSDIEGLVETSTNLASVKIYSRDTDEKVANTTVYGGHPCGEYGYARIGTSQRSSVDSERKAAAEKVEAVFRLAGAKVTHEGEYPGWKPNMSSRILSVCTEAYRRRFGVDAAVKAIHAGLECGLFLEKFPHLDMISFGPTLRGVHAPGERLELASLDKFAVFLDDVITDFSNEVR